MAESLVIAIAIILAAIILADRGPPGGGGWQPRASGRPIGPPPFGRAGAKPPPADED